MGKIYEIRGSRSDGTLSIYMVIARPNDASAVRLAHSLRGPSCDKVEIWRDDQCVHAAWLAQEPERACA